jgi:hypothetical protein
MTESKTALTPQLRKAIGYGFAGLVLILLGVKFILNNPQDQEAAFAQDGTPALLFFNVSEPCECMQELVGRADTQIVQWPEERRGGVQLVRLNIGENPDLEAKYKVFRAPALVFLDAQGEIVWRQDYPLAEGGPFKLEELEAVIAGMGSP